MTEEEIKALQATNEELVARVGQLESINVDLVGQKKELKNKLETGLTDEEAKAEIANLKSLLDGAEGEKSQLQADHTTAMNSMRMRDLLRESGVKAQNSDAMEALTNIMLDGVAYEDGFKWVNEDGTTKYNESNKQYGVIDRVNELKEGSKSYLFAPSKGGGGGETPPSATDEKPSINDVLNAGLTY